MTRLVVLAVVNDPYVVDEYANVCSAVHELGLARLRDIVELLPPSNAPSVPDTDSDELVASDDVATVLTNPVEPTYVAPCDSDDNLRADENVDDAVLSNPLTPSTDVVELPHDCDVNGNTCPASVEVEIVDTRPFEPTNENPCDSDGSRNDPVNLLVPENVFESDSSVDEANVQVDVEKLYTCPAPFTASAPVVSDGRFNVPANRLVDDAYPNEARVVDVFENVLSAVNVFDVYVLGIVVEAAIYELIELLRLVVSRVSAPPLFVRPLPSRLLND